MNRVISLIISIAVLVSMGIVMTSCGDPEKKAAKESFNTEAALLQEKIDERSAEVEKAQSMLDAKKPALDDTIAPALEQAVDTAVNDEVSVPSMPGTIEEISDTIEGMKTTEEKLVSQTEDIKNMEQELDKSQKQYAQIVAPTEEFVKERLKTVDEDYINEVEAVTEENDPNNLLGKQGSYTARVVYRSPLVKDEFQIESGLIEAGTDAGGCVEVFKTVSEAKTRDDYLGTFDGEGLLNPGSHHVFGTVIIRTSSELTASEQKELEKKVLDALTELSEDSERQDKSTE